MRIASFNAENLFERAKVLDLQSWAPGFGPRGDLRRPRVLMEPAVRAKQFDGFSEACHSDRSWVTSIW